MASNSLSNPRPLKTFLMHLTGRHQKLMTGKAARSLENGLNSFKAMHTEAMESNQAFQPGTLWCLQRIAEMTNDQAYNRLVDDMMRISPRDASARLVDPAAPKIQLPDDPGTGFLKFSIFVAAAIGEPESRAVDFLTRFLSQPGTGYVLTHQLLSLEWAKQQGLNLPEDLTRTKREEIVSKIMAELFRASVFNDLYAERAALVLLYGNCKRANANKWINVIINAQNEDGGWGEFSKPLFFEGQQVTSKKGDPSHTVAWAMLALAKYIDLYDPTSK